MNLPTLKAPMQERPAWHALDRAAVESLLQTNASGLSFAEARARLARYGLNLVGEAPPPSDLRIFLNQFRNPFVFILFLAALVALALHEYIDAGAVGGVLLLNAGIGFFQERQAERSVHALMQLLAPHARVLRESREWDIPSQDLVPGDLVVLESGSRVPADLRLISARALMVDESLLTGESLPVRKTIEPLPADVGVADRTNMVYAGTIVTSGRGQGYVVATGLATELGSIVAEVRREERVETPFQQRMERFSRIIGGIVVISALLSFLIGLWAGESPSDMFFVAVALAVSAVPEGLPIAFTVTLALGTRRMARRHAIIRRLPAVETLGSTTVIGSDKTGTLTENRMTVQTVWTDGELFTVRQDGPGAVLLGSQGGVVLSEHPALSLILLTGVLTNEAKVYRVGEDFEVQGDPTEAALLVAAARLGIKPEEMRDAYPLHAELPFEPDRQYSASIRRQGDRYFVFVKGAPERVLQLSRYMLGDTGQRELDRDRVQRAASTLAARGMRVLAMAYRPLPQPGPAEDTMSDPEELIFLGLVGLLDPPRPGVREAIQGCREAGIRVLMITGDHAETARAIGRDLGLIQEGARVLTGKDLERMDNDTLRKQVQEVSVYARITPQQKLSIVRALRSLGETVAITGDGVNDAPALKAADVGIAMGKSGTDVAREAADMVLADDNFVSIYAAVAEGRITFDNLRKVTFYLLSTAIAEVLTILLALVFLWPLPYRATQILWLNLVTEGLQAMALAFEPGEPDVLKRPPRRRTEGILSRLLWERTLVTGLVMAIGTLVLFQWELGQTDSLSRAQTVALTTMVVFQMFQVGNARSESRSLFHTAPLSNPFLLFAAAAASLVHLAALYLPPTQFILRVEPIEPEVWVRIMLMASTVLIAVELHKLLRSRQTQPATLHMT